MENNSSLSSTITISVGDALSVLGIAVPTALVLRRFHTGWKHWISRYYPNSVVMDLSIVVKNTKSNKYRLITRTILDTKLDDLIDNEHGRKRIHRAMQNCSFRDPFITIWPIQNQWYLYNKAISKIEQSFGVSSFQRATALNKNDNINNVDPIATEKFIFSLWCPYRWDAELQHITVDDIHSNFDALKEYLRFIFKKEVRTTRFRISKRLRGNFIHQQSLEALIREVDMKNIVKMEDEKKKDEIWKEMYDIGDMEEGSSMYHDRMLRWYFVKKVAEKYYKNEREWANPLSVVEIAVPNGQHVSVDEILSSNIYHPYTYNLQGEQLQHKLFE